MARSAVTAEAASPTNTMASRPSAALAAAALSGSRPTQTTRPPAAMAARAAERPSPDVPPMMTMTLPESGRPSTASKLRGKPAGIQGIGAPAAAARPSALHPHLELHAAPADGDLLDGDEPPRVGGRFPRAQLAPRLVEQAPGGLGRGARVELLAAPR